MSVKFNSEGEIVKEAHSFLILLPTSFSPRMSLVHLPAAPFLLFIVVPYLSSYSLVLHSGGNLL